MISSTSPSSQAFSAVISCPPSISCAASSSGTTAAAAACPPPGSRPSLTSGRPRRAAGAAAR